mgnify:CR=1 FL=1
MGLIKAAFAPGIDKQTTTYGAEGRWIDSKNVRFRTQLPEKIGGWQKVVTSTICGVVRGSLAWISLDGTKYLALGTERKLYIYSEGIFFDITPIRLEAALTNPFTTNATTAVSVAHTSHGTQVGDFVTYDSFSAIDGLDMNQEFEITSVTDANNYKVTHTSAASGSTSGGGGTGNAKYQLGIGTSISQYGYGWGSGAWNVSTWNTPRTTSNVTLESAYWSFDTFGEDLLALRGDDAVYRWDLSAGTGVRAVKISQAPTTSRKILVSSPDRHIFLFGTETTVGSSGTQDDLFIRFSSQEDYTTWAPRSTNSAGTFRIQDGSRIITAARSRGSILVWTDTSLHSLNNIGPPFIFGLSQVGSNCGAVSANCAVDVNGTTFWMSQTAFYRFDGAIKKLECSVQDYVFNDINATANNQVSVGVNVDFNEVTWYYVSSSADYIDRSVTYNFMENTWYTNLGFVRTSWIDRGVYPKPYGTKYDAAVVPDAHTILGVTAGSSTLYEHESGVNDGESAMDCYITSGDFDIQEGDQVFLISKIIPDFKNQVGDTTLRLEFANYPASTNVRSFTSATTSTTKFFSVRGRGRQANLKVSSTALNDDWRFGTVRMDIKPDGAR